MKTNFATEAQSRGERPGCRTDRADARPTVKVKFAHWQPALGAARAQVAMFTVLETVKLGEIPIGAVVFKNSTMTIHSIEKMGFRVEEVIAPKCADLKSPVERFDEAMMSAADMASDGDWNMTVTALEAALHEARTLQSATMAKPEVPA